MSFLNGIAMLLGAVWVVAYNVGVLRRLRWRGVLWRLSAAYVAANRFRTGLTLAMFALVVLSLTLSAVMLTATQRRVRRSRGGHRRLGHPHRQQLAAARPARRASTRGLFCRRRSVATARRSHPERYVHDGALAAREHPVG